VRRVEALGSTGSYGFVKLTVVPELWTLSLRQNSRIWQDAPVATIVREVLRDAGLYQGDGELVVARRCRRSRRGSTACSTARATSTS
jgi:uncharacterized protein involved in type VI secretion and phage assembly